MPPSAAWRLYFLHVIFIKSAINFPLIVFVAHNVNDCAKSLTFFTPIEKPSNTFFLNFAGDYKATRESAPSLPYSMFTTTNEN